MTRSPPPRLVLVPERPTDAMLIAARDWSAAKYGKAIGNDAAIGCFRAMLSSAPEAPSEEMVERVISGVVRAVAELPDRTSPLDTPDQMIVTVEELTLICAREFRAALAALLAGPR